MKYIEKGWGHELVIANTNLYCGKLLFFKKGRKCSLHYHKKKHETFYVGSGSLLVTTKWLHGEANDMIMKKGDSLEVPPGLVHQMLALEDTELYEFSTQHFDEDSYRIEMGD